MELNRDKINVVMARKNMTVRQLAENCSVSRNRINVILNSRKVTPAAAGKIARGLDVDVTEIIDN